MKIAFIGTHGTGKTTLAHKLVVALKEQKIDAGYTGEGTDICPFPINEKTTIEAQEWLILNKHIKELELEPKYDVLITDRSVVDCYAYYHQAFGKNLWMEEFVKEKSKNYSMLIKVPINSLYLKSDGIRSIDKKFQQDIDKKMDYLLKNLNIPFQEYENLNSVLNFIKNA